MTASLVTVFGGGGFLGRYVVQALLRSGARVRVAQRSNKRSWSLKAQANLGQIQFVAADITQPETVSRAVAGADAVVNLVGSFADMDAVQNLGAGHVATAAQAAGVRSLVHVSAIGANSASPALYGRSKAAGEDAVRKAFPAAVMMRPSIVFGREDQFVNRFAGLIGMLPVVPVIGGAAQFQPVYVGDVAKAIMAVLASPAEHSGQTFELGGPEVISMAALNEKIAQLTGRSPLFVSVPDGVAGALATLTGWLPFAPITADQWAMLQSDNVVSNGSKDLATLGIGATALEAVADNWLVRFRKHGRFAGKVSA